jgi:hypothetical protein
MEIGGLTMSGPRAGVVDNRGTAHWLYRDVSDSYTLLDVSADATRVSLTKIPMLVELQPPFPCIAGGGKVSLILARPEGLHTLVQLWTRQDQDDHGGGWQCSRLLATCQQSPHVSFITIGFAESSGAVLIKGCHGLVSLYIESEEAELVNGSQYPTEICSNFMCMGYGSCTKCVYNNDVLYEMDWSSYLVHLSAWSPREAQHT